MTGHNSLNTINFIFSFLLVLYFTKKVMYVPIFKINSENNIFFQQKANLLISIIDSLTDFIDT